MIKKPSAPRKLFPSGAWQARCVEGEAPSEPHSEFLAEVELSVCWARRSGRNLACAFPR
ncbi:MAG: hypothetical protein R6X19_03015 [Kiritimatiellia bacterium]